MKEEQKHTELFTIILKAIGENIVTHGTAEYSKSAEKCTEAVLKWHKEQNNDLVEALEKSLIELKKDKENRKEWGTVFLNNAISISEAVLNKAKG